jgi:hypothetical protein
MCGGTSLQRRGEGDRELEGDGDERIERRGKGGSVQGTEGEGRSNAGERLKREGSNGLER